MEWESTFRVNAKNSMLNDIYKHSIRLIQNDYKKIMKEQMTLDGLDPEDLAIHHFTLDHKYVWVGGYFKETLPYGLAPNYIQADVLKEKVFELNQKRKELLSERNTISTYLAKVLTESKTLKDIQTYLPPALHNSAEFKSVYEEGELTPETTLPNIATKYTAMINERMMLNLLVR